MGCGINPIRDHLDLHVLRFFAFVVDPCKKFRSLNFGLLLTRYSDTIITQSSHDIQTLLSASLTVDRFENVRPPDVIDDVPSEKEDREEQRIQVEIQITDCTIKPNKQYILPNLPNRRWQVSSSQFPPAFTSINNNADLP